MTNKTGAEVCEAIWRWVADKRAERARSLDSVRSDSVAMALYGEINVCDLLIEELHHFLLTLKECDDEKGKFRIGDRVLHKNGDGKEILTVVAKGRALPHLGQLVGNMQYCLRRELGDIFVCEEEFLLKPSESKEAKGEVEHGD